MIVTLNIRHFPRTACDPHGISVQNPDDLLCEVAEARPQLVLAVLTAQAARKARPPMSLPEMLDRLELHVPRFVGIIRDLAPDKRPDAPNV